MNSQILTNEAMALTELEEQEKRLAQLLTEKEQQQLKAEDLAMLLKQAEAQLQRTLSQLEKTRQQRDQAEAEVARLRQAATQREAALADLEDRLTLKTAAVQEVEERQAKINKIFSHELGIQNIEVDGNLQIFTFSADVLFRADRANLSPQGKQLLERFGQVLLENTVFYTRIEVEGHADENPSQNFYRSGDLHTDHGNWRLSAERATTVVQLFQILGIPGEQLAVVGRSFYEPVNRGPFENVQHRDEALAENRRVQVRLFYSERT